MRRLIVAALFLGFIFSTTLAFSGEKSLFQEANEKYQAGDYVSAASLYRKSAASGKPTAALYYNLGNADFRAGNKGAALVDYERAHALAPRDRDVEWNKSVLKTTLADRIADSDENVFISSAQRILNWVTVDEIALLFAFILAILFIVSVLSFSFHQSKSMTAGIGGFFTLLLILTGTAFYFRWLSAKDPFLVVLEKEVTARYGPSDKETKAFVLHEGAKARVIDQTDKWYYIALQDKTTGWVLKKSCEVI